MSEYVNKVLYKDKEIILIATAHVSQSSVDLVKQVLEEEKPDSVCVELDEGRYQNIQNPEAWEKTDISQVIRSKKVGFMLANLALGSYQKKMAEKLNTKVGGEMLQGIDSAKELGATLVLADRKIQTTFLRIWRSLGFIEKMKLIFVIMMTDDEEEVSDEDLLSLLQEDMLASALKDIRKEFPKIGTILIDERDQYLAAKIKSAPGSKVAAVLGGAHVPGIKEELFKEQNLDELDKIPARSMLSKTAGWIIPVAIVAAILYAFATNLDLGKQFLSSWFLWNSGFAALFTALSLAHPLSILTAFVIAPFSSLNPFLACGWFAGLVEASLRKPKVQDLKDLSTDFFSFKGFFKNRVLRIIIVVMMANIGSTIGTMIAGMEIIQNLL